MGDRSLAANDHAYDQLAGVYDALTAGYAHEAWLRRLHSIAAHYGSGGRRLLDVGCGTGSSFIPLLGDGYDVSACDVSAGMASIAAARADGRAQVFQADMRALPDVGSFDVVTCLDDVVNHVADRCDLVAAFRSIARSMAPRAIFVFDANTLGLYRGAAGVEDRFERDGHRFVFRAHTAPDMRSGGLAHVQIEVHTRDHHMIHFAHTARHHPVEDVQACLQAAGLRTVAVLGQTEGAVLHRAHSEIRHDKTLFVARRD